MQPARPEGKDPRRVRWALQTDRYAARWRLDLDLYDLELDPGELVDLSEREPERVRTLLGHFDGLNQQTAPSLPVDPDLAEKLRSLGYLD